MRELCQNAWSACCGFAPKPSASSRLATERRCGSDRQRQQFGGKAARELVWRVLLLAPR
jgi:hypothetical protein